MTGLSGLLAPIAAAAVPQGADQGWRGSGRWPVSAEDDGRRHEQVRTAAMMRGAAEALAVLRHRPAGEVRQASEYATGLLCRNAGACRLGRRGPAHARPGPGDRPRTRFPPRTIRPCTWPRPRWTCTAPGCARRSGRPAGRSWRNSWPARSRRQCARGCGPASTPRESTPTTSPRRSSSSLVAALERSQAAYGPNAYLTGQARRSLATAYRRRRTGTDLTNATALAADDTRAQAARYGPEHPVTLDARSLLAVYLLAQAESAPAERERRDLATRALSEITTVRAAQDRQRGVASPDSVASHRREARALLLLGEVGKARASMDFARRLESAAQEA